MGHFVVVPAMQVPESLIEQVAKERFAMMLTDMREKGSADEEVKEMITVENYERYKKISFAMNQAQACIHVVTKRMHSLSFAWMSLHASFFILDPNLYPISSFPLMK